MRTSNLIFAIFFLLSSGMLVAQNNISVEKVNMTIDGTSTLHDWTSTVNDVTADGLIKYNNESFTGIENLYVKITVASIESTKGSMMDNKTYNALKKDKHPNITYRLQKVNSIDKMGNTFKIRTQGDLTIAGKTNTIYMNVDGKILSNGRLQFEGAYTLNMTDYNVDPPTAMLGTIKTGEEVTIKFDLTLDVTNMSK